MSDKTSNRKTLNWLLPGNTEFPDVEQAWDDPDGLLAAGGDLSAERLISAYQHGIFPWYNEGEPILWWSPDPRCVIRPHDVKISRSLSKRIRKKEYRVTFNQQFELVIDACAAPRTDKNGNTTGTWISTEMRNAYINLHQLGYAHSVECWYQQELVGGLYGIAIGNVFFGESMFSRRSDASKVAFVTLCQKLESLGVVLIDGQVKSDHLMNLGFSMKKRSAFIDTLRLNCYPARILNLV